MQLVRSVRPSRRHCIAPFAQISGVIAWAVLAVWGARVIVHRTVCTFGESKVDIANMTIVELAREAYPAWLSDHPGLHCPPRLVELARYIDRTEIKDPWGNDYVLTRPPGLGPIIVSSAGEDGRFGTQDDLRSDLR